MRSTRPRRPSTRAVRAALAGALFAAVLVGTGCDRPPAETRPTPTPVAAKPAAPARAPAGKTLVPARKPSDVPEFPRDHPTRVERSAPSPGDNQELTPPPPALHVEVAEGPLEVTYPQDGTLFPPEIVAPTFTWQGGGEDANSWTITVRSMGDAELRFTADERRWRPAEEDWEEIKRRCIERDAEVTVSGNGEAGSARVTIRTSKDPVGDAIFYREVPLPFLSAVQDPSRIRWRFGTVDSREAPRIVLQNLPVCGNCHSFSDDASTLGLDVDYGNDKGAYAVLDVAKDMVLDDEKIITWADFRKEDGELTFGLLSRVSPTGRYVVSTVKDRSVFVAMPDLWYSQLFFPIKGILVVYDREKKTFSELPGADDPTYVQTNAVWSPDGRELVFARSLAYVSEILERKNAALIDEKDVPEFTRDRKPFRYDLYRIPFRDGKGGEAVPIEGASGNGVSNYFPKFSPDGKWIVFTKSDSYMLLQPDSELWIIPAAGGKARRLDCNTPRMNSWHSWSSNSRWLVFSSKKNTPYTQLFLTHIDEDGNDSPPVLLERFTSPDRAANIPEFVRLSSDAITEIREEFLDAYSFLRAGMANENTGNHEGAERAFRRGLELNPDSPELHNALGWTLFQAGRTPEAVEEYRKALEANPDHVKSHNNLALALVELGRLPQAADHYRRSVELEAKAEIHSDLGFIFARLRRFAEARAEYEKALELDPRCSSALYNLGVDYARAGEYAVAEKYYRKALEIEGRAETWNGLGRALVRLRRNDEAVEAYRGAVQADPDYASAVDNLADALARQGSYAEAEKWYRRSLDRRPTAPRSNMLGAVLLRMGREEEAVKQFETTLEIDPGNAEALRNLKQLQVPGL